MSGLHSGEPSGRQSREERGPQVLREKINEATKEAMKSGDKLKLSTLRLMNSAVKNGDIEARTAGKPPLSDEDLLGIFQKQIKQRTESIELYEKGGRAELAKQERDEIEVIKGFLPQQMSDAEVKAAIAAIIQETGAASVKDMGKVMAALKERYAGKMDFGKASGAVKGQLAG
jgi:uncharacterized protein YqeY